MSTPIPMFTEAVIALRPNVKSFSVSNDEYDKFVYDEAINGDTKPTEDEIKTAATPLAASWESSQYQRSRKEEYPNIGDQLDDLFHKGAFSTEMNAKLQAVKDKYPKPS